MALPIPNEERSKFFITNFKTIGYCNFIINLKTSTTQDFDPDFIETDSASEMK